MTFYWPHALWLLLVPLALLVRDLFRRRASARLHPKILRASARHATLVLDTAASLPARRPARVRLFLLLGLAAATLALARPQWGRIDEPVFAQAREILIALDLSRSMLSTDVKPARLDRAKLLITSLLEQLKGERVGLVVFSGTAFLQSPLSSDYEILSEFLPQLGPDFLPEGGTNYDALLDTSLSAFGSSDAADRFLIVLSDGEADSTDWKNRLPALKAKGIRVLSLGVGTPAGSMIPDGDGAFMKDERGAVVLSKLDSSTLRELATATGGAYSDASAWVDLPKLIQTTVDQGRRGQFKDTGSIRLVERYQWALAPALLFLLLSFWREFPVRPRPRALLLAAKPAAIAPLLLLLLSLFTLHPSLFAGASPAPTPDAPLTRLVGQLSARDTALDARDYATLATTTLDYGRHLDSAQQPVPPGPVNDALAAVAAGQTLDPKAADWPSLRNRLAALLDKKNPPPPDKKDDKKQPDKNKPDPKKNDDSKQDKKDSGSSKSDQKKPDSPNDPSKSPSSPDQQKGGSSPQSQPPQNDPHNPGDGQGQKPSDQPANQPPGANGQSAFGDMNDKDKPRDKPAPAPKPDPSAPPPATPAPGDMQQVGGTPQNQAAGTTPIDPALVVPLQNLDQVRQQDSPVRLYQLLQDPHSPTPARSGHNW